jgi:hypothetical protein
MPLIHHTAFPGLENDNSNLMVIYASSCSPLFYSCSKQDTGSDNMAIVSNKKEVLSIKGKVKVIRQIGNRKGKAGVCWEFGFVNCVIQKIWESITKVICTFEQNSSRIK